MGRGTRAVVVFLAIEGATLVLYSFGVDVGLARALGVSNLAGVSLILAVGLAVLTYALSARR